MSAVLFVLALAFSGTAQAGCTVIQGASVHLPDGSVSVEDVSFEGAKIAASVGGDCAVVKGANLHLTAGFIEVGSQLGLVEVSMESATRDADGGGTDPIRAALRVADAYNPRSTLIPIQRLGGVTGALTVPDGGRISGQAAHVSLAGATQAETVQNPSVAMWANLGGPSRAQSLRELRNVLQDAKDFRRLKPSYDRNATRPLAASGLDLEALWPVLDGTIPLVVGANRAADIEALLRLRQAFGIRLVIQGAAEGWLLAKPLAAADVAVIVDPYVYGPGGFGQIQGRADNAALLAEAGVAVILTTQSSHNARNLGQMAGNAVRGGMTDADALASITAIPAKVFGLEGRGVVEVGASADLVLWTGDPLELSSHPVRVWINGRDIVLESRQTQLRDAYRVLPGTPKTSLELP